MTVRAVAMVQHVCINPTCADVWHDTSMIIIQILFELIYVKS